MSASALSHADANVPLRFRGDWQGTVLDATLPSKSGELQARDPMELRIVITDEGAKMFRRVEGGWDQLDSRVLKVAVAESTAFTYSIWQNNRWAATWSIGMTLIDTKRLHVAFVRQLNDKRAHLPDPDAVKISIAYGLLERTSDDE